MKEKMMIPAHKLPRFYQRWRWRRMWAQGKYGQVSREIMAAACVTLAELSKTFTDVAHVAVETSTALAELGKVLQEVHDV